MEMERQNKKMQVWNLLAEKIRKLVEESVSNPEELQEIRIRTGQPLLIQMKGQERVLPDPVHPYLVTKEDIGETMGYICHYSLYAYENELKQGFITVEGGHRVGVAGKVIIENEKVKNIKRLRVKNNKVAKSYIKKEFKNLIKHPIFFMETILPVIMTMITTAKNRNVLNNEDSVFNIKDNPRI